MAKLHNLDQESGASSPPPLDTSAMLAALARDVAATREDVAALRVNLSQLSEEVRARHERAAPNRYRSAREVLVSTAKNITTGWHHTIAGVGRDIERVAATARRCARSTRVLLQPGITEPPTALLAAIDRRWEIGMVTIVLAVSAFLNLHDLTSMPPGLHGDEAAIGFEGRRILDEGWIGPYSGVALGTPTGPIYLTAVSVWLFGNTIFAVRLVPAVMGTLTVAALYLLLRRNLGARVALVGASLLAVMTWHVHFARVGFPAETWTFIVLVATGALVEALRSGSWGWWAAAGATAGLGIYVYNPHPLVIGIMGLFILIHLLTGERVASHSSTARVATFAVVLAIVALPMARFAADPNSGYFNHARHLSITSTDEWAALDGLGGRVAFLADRYVDFWDRVCCHSQVDGVDALGDRPPVPRAILLLAAFGVVVGLWRRWRPLVSFGSLIVLLLPLAAVLTVGGAERRALALAPFLAMFAALGIVELLEIARRRRGIQCAALTVATVSCVGLAVLPSVAGSAASLRASQSARWVFGQEMADAAQFMSTLPSTSHVYFYSARWSVNYETRQFLAPHVSAEDRSAEFGHLGFDIDPTKGTPVFIFLGEYQDRLEEVRQRYPGGQVVRSDSGPEPSFVAYLVPAAD
jgi:4-amino-4-deoxy-L-arabinose transferase-like glycosyltransferase